MRLKRNKPITNMRIQRVIKDVSMQEVADSIGVSQQYYFSIEVLKEVPTDQRAKQLEEYFNKDIDYLLSLAE